MGEGEGVGSNVALGLAIALGLAVTIAFGEGAAMRGLTASVRPIRSTAATIAPIIASCFFDLSVALIDTETLGKERCLAVTSGGPDAFPSRLVANPAAPTTVTSFVSELAARFSRKREILGGSPLHGRVPA